MTSLQERGIKDYKAGVPMDQIHTHVRYGDFTRQLDELGVPLRSGHLPTPHLPDCPMGELVIPSPSNVAIGGRLGSLCLDPQTYGLLPRERFWRADIDRAIEAMVAAGEIIIDTSYGAACVRIVEQPAREGDA